jgi:hypothetical protein
LRLVKLKSSFKIIEQQHANEDHFHSLMLLTMLLLNQLLPLAVPDNVATAAGRPRLDRVQSAPALIDSTRIPNPKIKDNVAAESATAAGRPALFRTQSAGSRIGEGITGGASIPAVKAVPDNVATAAGRPRLDRVQSAPALIDSTRIPNPKIEEALAAKTRKELITVGLLGGGVGGISGGLIGNAVASDQF